YGTRLLTMGRLDTLAAHLNNLSPKTLHQHPTFLSYLGDLAGLHSRFQEALGGINRLKHSAGNAASRMAWAGRCAAKLESI
nr:hypothetical protein [Chloroflexota bacterium]